ncbi:hypothetical protein N0V90_011195 [Kalmusia sp. IMI 367209]|nr:hypothetical protein N0V90_011195 [Kalmusia sp. IMI 367209]
MRFYTILLASGFAAFASATFHKPDSRLDNFLNSQPDPSSNATFGSDTDIVQVKRGMGKAILGNRCDHDIWVWSVDGKGSSPAIRVPARSHYSEHYREPCEGCGVSFKVSNTDQLQAGKQTQFEYAIKNNILYYDISFVDCAKGKSADDCPGHHNGLGIDSPNGACKPVNCPPGKYCPTQSYYVDQPLIKLGIAEPVFGCGSAGVGMDVQFKVCSKMAPLKRSVAGRLEIEDGI